MGLFASANPDRVEKLFLASPVGFEAITDSYDPYSIRVQDRSNTVPPAKKVDQLIYERENKIHAFGTLVDVPAE